MKKILIDGMTCNKGGKETFIINHYKKLIATDRYEFTFISYDDEMAYEDYLKETGASVIHLPPRNRGLVQYVSALNRLLREGRFDVVWAHETSLSRCELLMLAKLHRVPKRLIHSHSSSNMGSRFTYIMHSINKVFLPLWVTDRLACSESAAKWFYRGKNYRIIKNGIDVEQYRFDQQVRDSIRDAFDLGDSLVIGHVGRFGFEKNHKKLINVFNNLLRIRPDSKLLLCGDGEERSNIEAQIKELGICDNVLLLGVVDNVHQILQAVDVLVMPSLFEGLPFALLEAQASGLNCVVSDTVSKEADVTDQIVFLPLELDDYKWAEVIAGELNSNREASAEVIIHKGFDINESVRIVEDLLD